MQTCEHAVVPFSILSHLCQPTPYMCDSLCTSQHVAAFQMLITIPWCRCVDRWQGLNTYCGSGSWQQMQQQQQQQQLKRRLPKLCDNRTQVKCPVWPPIIKPPRSACGPRHGCLRFWFNGDVKLFIGVSLNLKAYRDQLF